ncbi:Ubiquitin carboxyl-terminal hydrolase 48 [Chionoecetes opilio]|uniref:Ubiquitin carboxyl-terminal hydrolase 48 n=1 Tax=Chionoecetes opilio TaxID=41210 RepID=A0A8J4YEJ6_CHIOP|nr:Ubiquitin carboxyl-terminal hydrolase 48 [Chionoecetes opilio]
MIRFYLTAMLEESERNCESGRLQKKQFWNLFSERKRPHPARDPGTKVYVISRDFYHLWKSYVRSCERGNLVVNPPERLENASLFCPHDHLLFPVMVLEPHELSEHLVLVWEEEWVTLKELYPPDHVISAFYSDAGCLMTEPAVCDNGCVELRLAKDYEEQFSYEHQIIHVRQSLGPRKKPRLSSRGASSGGGASNVASNSQRLVRASCTFSSTDTIREVQNFIAERTGIWPMLQTLWVCGEEQQKAGEADGGEPLQLTDDHRAMTLNALRVRPGDTIYFRAARCAHPCWCHSQVGPHSLVMDRGMARKAEETHRFEECLLRALLGVTSTEEMLMSDEMIITVEMPPGRFIS